MRSATSRLPGRIRSQHVEQGGVERAGCLVGTPVARVRDHAKVEVGLDRGEKLPVLLDALCARGGKGVTTRSSPGRVTARSRPAGTSTR